MTPEKVVIGNAGQRVGEWKRQGCLIGDKWVITKGGAKVKAYRVLRAAKKVA